MLTSLSKISPKLLIKAFVLVGLLLLVAGNARIILENILKSKDIDERIVSAANPRLNRKMLEEAAQILESSQSSDLTAIFPSVTVEQEGSETPEIRAKVEIENASGITGAAASLAEVLETKGFQVGAISTAPSLQEKTTVVYKVGLEREAEEVKQVLEGQQWTVSLVEQNQDLTSDIRIALGKK